MKYGKDQAQSASDGFTFKAPLRLVLSVKRVAQFKNILGCNGLLGE